MAYQSKETYPRPDFVHTNHRWTPINDGWSILFDDEDVGLGEGWHISGVPEKVTLASASANNDENNNKSLSEAEARKLAAFPELVNRGFRAPRMDHAENVKKPINVPFVFQAPASGVEERDVAHEVMWYERRVADPRGEAEAEAGDRVLVRFGAVDYEVTIWASGQFVGRHRGGHVPFDIDLTDALRSRKVHEGGGEGGGTEIVLVLRVQDSPSDLAQPRGKQYWAPKPESIFYTPSSGIWQPVWLEVVSAARIGDSSAGTVLRGDDIWKGTLEARVAILGRRAGHKYSVEIEGSLNGFPVAKKRERLPKDKDHAILSLLLTMNDAQQKEAPIEVTNIAPFDDTDCWHKDLALWSPDHPTLYDLVLRLFDASDNLVDEVKTYTGFRHLNWTKGDGTFRLNGKPLFQALCLDQGYWPETGLTPPSPAHLKADIELAKQMGFNGCRKHQKVEDPVFLYWADKLGYLVWGEMANAYEFGAEYVDRFDQEWAEAVRRDLNHPSIVAWTPVNESWGYTSLKDSSEQRNHIRSLYYQTKSLDPTRPINDNCGWEHVCTDLSTFHDYSDAPDLSKTCATLESMLTRDLAGGRRFFVEPIDPSVDAGAEHRKGAPVLCTEFGGVNIALKSKGTLEGGTQGGGEEWGYTTASDPKDLVKRIEALVDAVVQGRHCCGFVYTQLTDIEQEVNGVYAFNRNEKIPAAAVKKIIDAAQRRYYESLPR